MCIRDRPVVAACVILPAEPLIEFVNDSKKLSEGRREKLAPVIRANALAVGTGWADAREIDAYNIPVSYTHLDVYKRQDLNSCLM